MQEPQQSGRFLQPRQHLKRRRRLRERPQVPIAGLERCRNLADLRARGVAHAIKIAQGAALPLSAVQTTRGGGRSPGNRFQKRSRDTSSESL